MKASYSIAAAVFCALAFAPALAAQSGKGQPAKAPQNSAPIQQNAPPGKGAAQSPPAPSASGNIVPLAQAYQMSEQGVRLLQQGDAERALGLFEQASRSLRHNLGDRHPDAVTGLFNHAFTLRQMGRYQEAEPLFAELVRLRRLTLGERSTEAIVAINEHATILQIIGRQSEAEPIFAQLVQTGREVFGERDQNTLVFLANHGRVLLGLGRADEAEPIVSEALRVLRADFGNRNIKTLAALATYASILEALNREAEAEALHLEALRLRRAALGDRHPDTVESLNNYATVLLRQGKFSEAEPLMAQALRQSREVLGERNLTTILAVGNYGNALSQLGRLEEAESYYRQALQMQREVLGVRHPNTLMSLNNHAAILTDLDRLADAAPIFAEGLPLFREELGDRHPSTQLLLTNYAVVQLRNAQPVQALDMARELASINRSRAAGLSDLGVRGSTQRNRELAKRQGSERLLADALWANWDRPGIDRGALSLEAFTALQLASAGSTSRAVRETAATRFASGFGLQDIAQERQQLVQAWFVIEGDLVASEAGGSATPQSRDALREDLAAIEARIARIDQRLASDAPQYFAILGQQAVEIERARAILADDEAVLFLVPTDYGTHSMAVTKTDISWSWAPIGGAEIGNIVADFRIGLEIAAGDEYLPLFDLDQAYGLYRDLIAPVEGALADKSRVYVIADGALSRLPLGTLTTAAPVGEGVTDDPDLLRGADWLADRYALVQLPSLQSLVYIRSYAIESTGDASDVFAGFGAPVLQGQAAVRGARSATLAPVDAARLTGPLRAATGTALMNPDALRTLAALPGTQAELEQVREALGAPADALYLGAQMTEAAIRDADLSGVHILHLATHGFTSEESGEAAEPGLVFTPPDRAQVTDDGYLAASEVVGLDLSSARWVILSACNTASPSGAPGETGLSGLAQAFFYAGAQTLLVSHWPVFDEIAPALTVEALRASQAGQPRAEALQAAMRAIRENPALDAAHPAVWAPFTLVGDGR